MRVILHVGTHKTGTTSIQSALAGRRDWLRARGYIYPTLSADGHNHNSLAHLLASNPADSKSLKEELSTLDGEALVLSAEEIWAITANPTDWDEFSRRDYWRRRNKHLGRFRDLVDGLGPVAVYICLRRQDEFAASLYSTKILSNRFYGSFAEFRRKASPLFDYRSQIEHFRAVFDDVQIKSFDDLRGDLIAAFCDWIAIPALADVSPRQKITPDARLIAWISQWSGSDDELLKALRRKFAISQGANFVDRGNFTLWASGEERNTFLANECVDPAPGFFSRIESSGGVPVSHDDLLALDAAFEEWRCGLSDGEGETMFKRRDEWRGHRYDNLISHREIKRGGRKNLLELARRTADGLFRRILQRQ